MRILLLLALFISINTFAQFEQGTVYLRDGDSLTGLVKVHNFPYQYIRYKEGEKGKRQKLDHKKVRRIEVTDENGDKRIYEYKIAQGRKYATLFYVKSEGAYNLYALVEPAGANPIAGSQLGFDPVYLFEGDGPVVKEGSMWRAEWVETEYFLGKYGRDAVLKFPESEKKAIQFFKDCPALVERLKTEEYRRVDRASIINFYNVECVE